MPTRATRSGAPEDAGGLVHRSRNPQHPCSSFGFSQVHATAGVRSQLIRRPTTDPNYVVIDLEFEDEAAATACLHVLQTRIWTSPANSPALAGAPTTRLLTTEGAGASAQAVQRLRRMRDRPGFPLPGGRPADGETARTPRRGARAVRMFPDIAWR